MSYEKPEENEWVQPVTKDYRMACCDCGLVHNMDFRIKSGKVQFRVRRNNRATAGMRVSYGWRKGKDGVWRNTRALLGEGK